MSERSAATRLLLTAIKILIGMGLLYFSLSGIDWSLLVVQFESTDMLWLTIASMTVLLSLVLKVLRWSMLLRIADQSYSAIDISGAYFLGQAANILLPFRGGELVRLGWLRSQHKGRTAHIGTTIVLEKYLDLMVLAMILILVIVPLRDSGVQPDLVPVLVPVIVISLLLVFGFWMFPSIWHKVKNMSFLPENKTIHWLTDRLDEWVADVLLMRDIKRWIQLTTISLVIWGIMCFTNIFLMRAVEISIDVRAGLLVLVFVYLGLLPGLMPGNLGPFYYFSGLALSFFDVTMAKKVAFSVLLHGIVTTPPLVAAGVFLIIFRRRKDAVHH